VKGINTIIGMVCIALMVGGCSVTVIAPQQTKIKAENNLSNLTVEIGTSSVSGVNINLYNVGIGDDVEFASILSGAATGEQVTTNSGKVDILIGEADVVSTFGTRTFPNITGMTTYITKDVTNTVDFNDETAQVIVNKLAKRMAAK
jgi:hypothetical protein